MDIEYKYKIKELQQRPVIAIKIYGAANRNIKKQIINDMVDAIALIENINPVEYFIVFGSSLWNGYTFSTGIITRLNCISWADAAIEMMKL